MPLLLLIPQMLLLLAPLTPLQPQELGSLPPVPHQIAACKVSVNRQEHCHAKKDHLQDECGTPGHQRRCTIDEFRCHPQSNLCRVTPRDNKATGYAQCAQPGEGHDLEGSATKCQGLLRGPIHERATTERQGTHGQLTREGGKTMKGT
eukprot:383172-Pelagomonas_calceolata.AAC.6